MEREPGRSETPPPSLPDRRIPPDRDPTRRPRRAIGEGAASGLRVLFFVVGSLLNLVALLLIFGNIITLFRVLFQGQQFIFEPVLLAPLGAFLAGLICYLIAWQLD